MANKFWSLSLINNQNISHTTIIDDVQQSLIAFYQDHAFYNLFGADAVKYVCGLATRYAYHTCNWNKQSALLTHSVIQSFRGYALWLSIVWLIDGLCDKYRKLVTPDDLNVLTNIMLGKPYVITSKSMALLLLFDITQLAYNRYMELMPTGNDDSKQQLDDWTLKYFSTLLDDDKQTFTLEQYGTWRLNSGAMMCVVWHELLMNPEYDKAHIDTNVSKAFELVSLIVSYHNDLVSLHRDIEQETPNLVTTLNKGDYWEATIAAMAIVDDMYEELLTILSNIEHKYIVDICRNIVHGSVIWTAAEKRYAKGLSMLQLVMTHQRKEFLQSLHVKTVVEGDPML